VWLTSRGMCVAGVVINVLLVVLFFNKGQYININMIKYTQLHNYVISRTTRDMHASKRHPRKLLRKEEKGPTKTINHLQ
jgi:hypothetical protein